MTIRKDRRERAIDQMADYLLSEGLAGATLRPLAAAAGTSDRMLLYYFGNKDDLLTAVLDRIASRLLDALERAIPVAPPRPFTSLLEQVWAVLSSSSHRPFMNIWLDLAAAAARNRQPHGRVAAAIADGYLAWVTERLEPEADVASFRSASLFLAMIEGMYLLDAIGRPAVVQEARMELTQKL